LRPAGDVAALTQAQDVLSTLIDLCGLKKPRGAKYDGISLARLLRGKTDDVRDRMLVVQFSRMNRPRPWKGDAAVLWRSWRLVADKELYDVASDRGQQTNVVASFPKVAAKMRQHYDRWWQKVEPRVHEFSPIHIGSDRENPSMLTPCDWRDVFLDQQAQVRRVRRNGTWSVFVERDGDYEFALRRWPMEADAHIVAGVPEYKGVDGVYAAGEALPIRRARLTIAGSERSAPVSREEKEIKFTLPLKRGKCELRTAFEDADGNEICGAYYVYVQRAD
jgi:arylsulfatase